MSADDGPGTREVAQRLFAAEFEDADFEYSESDEERAPNYVVTPTGARVNRLFVVGVLTEVETVNENTLRGRVVDPTGAFVSYAGQYQPDEMAFLDRTRPPAFVALTGKARTFQPDDSDVVYTSVRPERFGGVDQATRDRWTVSAAEATLRRVAVLRDALAMDVRGDALREALEDAGVRSSVAAGVPLALEHYDTGERYLEAVRTLAVQTLEVVAGDREEVEPIGVEPDARGGTDLGPLPEGVTDSVSRDAADTTADAADTTADAADTTADAADTQAESETTTAATAVAGGDASEEDDEIDEFDTGEVAESFADAGAETATPGRGAASEGDTDATVGGETASVGGSPASDDGSTDDATTAGTTNTDAGVDGTNSDETTGEAATGDDRTNSDETTGEAATGDDRTSDDGLSRDEPVAGDDATIEKESSNDVTDPGSFDAGGFETDDPEADEEDLGSFDPEEDALTEEERQEVEEEFGVGFSSGSEVPDPEESDLDAPDPEEITPDPAAGETPATDSAADAGDPSSPAVESDASDGPNGTTTADATAPPTAENATSDTTDPGVTDDTTAVGATDATADADTTDTTADADTTDTTADADTTDATADADTTDATADADTTDATADDGATDADEVDLTTAVVEVMTELDEGDGADREKVMAATIERYGATPDAVEDAIQDALMDGQCYEAGGGLKPI